MPNLKALQHQHAGKLFHSYYYFKLEVHLRHKIKATVTCAEYQSFWSGKTEWHASCIYKLIKNKKLFEIYKFDIKQ